MDETNRVAAIFLSLLLMSCALLVILLAWGAPDESIKRIADLASYLNDHNTNATQLLVTFGALIFVLLGAMVIIVELAPPQGGSVKIAKVGSGDARIGTDEIARRLEEELRAVPRLRSVEATVSSRGSRAGVKLDLVVDTEADVAEAAGQAIQRARDIVETRMGVELDAPPRAEVHYGEEAASKRAPVGSAPAPASTPSWQPSASNPARTNDIAPRPMPQTDQTTSASEPIHEASSSAHEDRPSGA
jgi:hypothetical protein